MKTFYLGTGMAGWLGEKSPLPAGVPVCVSRSRLSRRKSLPRANRPWFYDCSGYSVLDKELRNGEFADWDVTPRQFVKEVARYIDEIGNMDAAASMDWMCEKHIRAKTGLDLDEHLRRSVHSCLELWWLAPNASVRKKIIPVVQGDPTLTVDYHLRCIDMYEAAGIDLTELPLVGVGSVCGVESAPQIVDLFAALHRRLDGKANFHAFGVKSQGLARVAPAVQSADSQAWSRSGQADGLCVHKASGVKWEANCSIRAMEWYDQVLKSAGCATLATWGRELKAYIYRGNPGVLFDGPAPAVNMPTDGQRIARAVRALLPGVEEHFAGLLDAFRAQVANGETPAENKFDYAEIFNALHPRLVEPLHPDAGNRQMRRVLQAAPRS